MSGQLIVRNRVRAQRVHLRLLRQIVETLLEDLLGQQVMELGIYLVGRAEITRLNEVFLRHRGVTDVIAFDYQESLKAGSLYGEVFVCVDEARTQAHRFHTSWQNELVRYIAHGILHLGGYDDRRKLDRLRMKRRENQLVRQLKDRFPLESIG